MRVKADEELLPPLAEASSSVDALVAEDTDMPVQQPGPSAEPGGVSTVRRLPPGLPITQAHPPPSLSEISLDPKTTAPSPALASSTSTTTVIPAVPVLPTPPIQPATPAKKHLKPSRTSTPVPQHINASHAKNSTVGH